MKSIKKRKFWQLIKIGCYFFIASIIIGYQCHAQSLPDRIEEYMQAQMELENFSGTILLAKGGEILFRNSYGMANYEHDVENTALTKFRIASITKQFTAMAVMQLCERGLINLDDKLSKFIPDFPEGDNITIHQLLIHTSGVQDFLYTAEYQKIKTVKTPLTDIIELIKHLPLNFPPGEKSEYSNSGYVILGFIIEQVSGESYADFLQENIFDPLGMESTCCSDYNKIIKHRASGYFVEKDGLINADYTDISFADGSGWLYSTAEDLYLWDRALYTDKLLSNSNIIKIFTPYIDKRGYGWAVYKKDGRNITSASGRVEGFHTRILRYPEENACIIVLSNYYHGKVSEISKDLASILFGDVYEIPKAKKYITMTIDQQKIYVGEYEFEPGNNLNVVAENGKLFMAPPGQSLVEIFPLSEIRFYVKAFDAYLEFQKDEQGKICELEFLIGGNKMKAQKI